MLLKKVMHFKAFKYSMDNIHIGRRGLMLSVKITHLSSRQLSEKQSEKSVS
jgi:hypothetical protein